jgi:hypothetical protein
MTMKLEDIGRFVGSDVKTLILTALGDNAAIEAIVRDSVEHDNGFQKIVLQERGLGRIGCRIHAWHAGYADSNVHTHRWDMASFILDGDYTAAEFTVGLTGTFYHRYAFRTKEVTDYSLAYKKMDVLCETGRKTYKKGDHYILPKGALHKIGKVSEKGALTVMLSWGDELEEARVYSQTKLTQLGSSQKPLTKPEVENRLRQVIEQIQLLEIK